jgi:hypothetical protein
LPACERGRFICYVFTCAIIIICILVEKKGGGGKPTPTAPWVLLKSSALRTTAVRCA